jgi:hypothetical protein
MGFQVLQDGRLLGFRQDKWARHAPIKIESEEFVQLFLLFVNAANTLNCFLKPPWLLRHLRRVGENRRGKAPIRLGGSGE